MKLLIKSSDFEHIKEESTYNHNYYKCKDTKRNETIILEICHEFEKWEEYYLIEKNEKNEISRKIFLGCGESGGFVENVFEFKIDFRLFYT